jgi:sugar phosphate permease
MIEGFREVGRRAAAGLGLLSFLTVRSMLTFVVLATAFVSRELIQTKGTLSTVIPAAAGALGAALGFVIAHAVRDRVRPARIVSGALIAGAVGMLAFGGIITLLGISLMAFSVGLAFFLGKVGVDTMMQQALADRFRGRGFSLQDIAYNLSWLIPAFVLFLALTEDTARILLVTAGVVFLVIATVIAFAARRLPAATGTEPARAR